MAEASPRSMWPVFETYHAVTYFAPESAECYRDLGLKGGWMGYFASRSAPMGPVPAEVVTAVFFNFHPAMVARAIPLAWALATPADVLTARLRGVDASLRRLLPDEVDSPAMVEAARLAREVAGGGALAGRPLYGALRSLSWPEDPHLALWHATTLLREHRGDGHVAALLGEGLDACEAHVTLAAAGAVPREVLQVNRRWTDDDWAAAEARLADRGWLDVAGAPTEAGRAGRQRVEDRTDQLAAEPWRRLGPDRTARLDELIRPFARAIVDRGGMPTPSPIGLPPP